MSEHQSAPPAPVERLAYNAAETCAILGIKDTSLWRLAHRGLLVPVKHLRHRIYSRVEIDRFLAGATFASRKARS